MGDGCFGKMEKGFPSCQRVEWLRRKEISINERLWLLLEDEMDEE